MYIIVTENNNTNQFNLESFGKDVVSFGRNTDNDIIINSPSVSRVHGCIYKENGGWKISDLDSTNGLYDGQFKIKEKVISQSTKIMIKDTMNPSGDVTFTFKDNINSRTNENNQSASGNGSGKSSVGPYEVQKAIISGGYVENYGILTDKRFYFRGRCYSKSGLSVMDREEEWTVDLEDITATGYSRESAIILKLAAIICLVGGTLWALAEEAIEVAGVAILFAGLFFLFYLASKKIVYMVTFAGGSIDVDVSKYGGVQAVQEFDNKLRREKDKRRAN